MSSTAELSKLNHHKNLVHWQQMVYDCRSSGQTVRAWCLAQGISEKSYYYRQRKVWEAAQQKQEDKQGTLLPSPHTASNPTTLPTIIPCAQPLVSQHPEPATTPALVLRSQAWTVEVNPGCDPELLRLALRAVK